MEAHSSHTLQPARALATVSWITALVVLGFNDHVLKHAELLPQWLTGKLSDFAGLYVAPALLAVLLRVRTRRGLLAAHVATGAVFAAINLDPRAADALVRMLARLGIEWRIVTDAADLIALPMLALSFKVLGAAMTRVDALGRAQQLSQRALAASGLLLCMATSDSWDDEISTSGPHLHNPTKHSVTILMRPLRESFVLDCTAIAADPGGLLPDDAFEVATAYEMKSRANLAVTNTRSDCNAVLVSGSDLSPVMVFWDASAGLSSFVPREYDNEKQFQPGAIILHPGEEGLAGYTSFSGDFVFERSLAREDADSCALPDGADRPVTDGELPVGRRELLAADVGPDGCIALRLGPDDPLPLGPFEPGPQPGDDDAGIDSSDDDAGVGMSDDDTDGDPDDTGGNPAPRPDQDAELPPVAYVCVPPGMFPFAVGDMIEIGESDLGPTFASRNESQFLNTQLLAIPLRKEVMLGDIDFLVQPRAGCGFVPREGCAEVVAPATIDVLANGEHVTLHGGEAPRSVRFGIGAQATIAVPFVRWRVGLDAACTEGDTELGADGVLVVVIERKGEQP